jgi:hypothetical protein
MQNTDTVEINGRLYVAQDTLPEETVKDMVMIRSESAGVFFGNLVEKNLPEGWVKLKEARRCWYWSGAASLSQLAVEGTSKPKECKFPVAVPEQVVMKVIEILSLTPKALTSLNSGLGSGSGSGDGDGDGDGDGFGLGDG